MADKIGEIQVNLKINDREYTQGAQRASASTKKLADETKNLGKDLKATEVSAKSAGSGLTELGQKADTTGKKLGNLQKMLGASTQSILGGIGSGLGIAGMMTLPGLLAGGLGMAGAASEQNAQAISTFGLASGGNSAALSEMQKLYRQINLGSTISTPNAGALSAKISQQFGWMSPSERSAFASQIAKVGELRGEDALSLADSLNKLARAVGSEYGFGRRTMPEILGQLGYTAAQTNASVTEAAAGSAAIVHFAKKEGITPEQAMNLLIAGNKQYGLNTLESASLAMQEIAKTREPTTLFNREFRQVYPTPMSQVYYSNAYRRYWPQEIPVMDLGTETLYPTATQQQRRETDKFLKGAGDFIGSMWDSLTTMENYKYNDVWNYYGNPMAQMRGEPPGSQYYPSITVNQYFPASETPSVGVANARKVESFLNANR